jgi:hypothetical protein
MVTGIYPSSLAGLAEYRQSVLLEFRQAQDGQSNALLIPGAQIPALLTGLQHAQKIITEQVP